MMPPPYLSLSASTLLAVVPLVLFAIWKWFISPRRHPPGVLFPPGPPGEPIIGHLRIIPADNPEYAYAQWSRQLNSDVLFFRILGQPIVVLNSVRAAVDLLDRRGANYCDRPRFVLFEVMGWRHTLTFLRWGAAFRAHRRALQGAFQRSAVTKWRPLQEREALTLLQGLARHSGRNWEASLRRFATAVVMHIGFGVDVVSDDDQYIQISADASYALGHAGAPAGTLVDHFPILRHLPNWLLRNRALKFARDWRWAIRRIHDAPFDAIQASGQRTDSLAQRLLDERQQQLKEGKGYEMSIEDIKGAAGAVYVAGQDTTWASLLVFVLNMVLHPEVQAKAQRQLDEVLGSQRLPTFEDRAKLPYIDYIVQEVLRWCPVSPVGVPHKSLEDDIYDGMFIPKGSVVIANARAMTHDGRVYQNPDHFEPERYISIDQGGRGEPFPRGQFGFGRRICVGQHLAEASIWIVVASMLSTFDISKAVDRQGREITPEVSLTNGLTSHTKSFPCRIVPRSQAHLDLIMGPQGLHNGRRMYVKLGYRVLQIHE